MAKITFRISIAVSMLALAIWWFWNPSNQPISNKTSGASAFVAFAKPPDAQVILPIEKSVHVLALGQQAAPSIVQRYWKANLEPLENVDELEQKELDRLYRRAGGLIQANEAAVLQRIKKSFPKYLKNEVAESFFVIQSWVRYSLQPTQIVEFILNFQPPLDPPNLPTHHGQTKLERYRQIKAFSIRELREQIVAGNIHLSSSEENRIVEKLTQQAVAEKSLDVSLEIFEFLKIMRAEKEIQTALEQRSEYDRHLIGQVLAL